MFDDVNLTGREWFVAAVFALLALASLFEGEPAFALLMGAIAGIYVSRQTQANNESDAYEDDFEVDTRRRRPSAPPSQRRPAYRGRGAPPSSAPRRRRRRRPPPVEYQRDQDYMHRREIAQQERPANVDAVQPHAIEAVRRIGLDPEELQVLPVDIGLLSFHGDDQPAIHRVQPVEDDADYVQPYMQLRVPVTANGRVRFEILDSARRTVFVHENVYDLKRGRNLIMPNARLPIHDELTTGGRWTLRIAADGLPLATHEFSWQESEAVDFKRHISSDGEISYEMRAMLQDSELGSMSLDELLSADDDEANASYQ